MRTIGTRLLALSAVAFSMIAVGHGQGFLTHHTRPAISNGQAPFVASLPASQTMRLTVTLPLRNQAGLENFLEQLYNPNSPSYHQFLTVEQFTAQYGPTQDDYNTVQAYLEEHGFTVVGTSINRLNIDVAGPVSAVESAFHVKMGQYQHPTESRNFYAPNQDPTVDLPFPLWHVSGLDNYSIPHSAGLDKRPAAGKATSGATTGSGPSASFLGGDMRAAYYGSGNLTGAGQYLGLLEYYGTDMADLNTYFTNIGKTNPVPVSLVSTDGTSTSCVDSGRGACDDTEQTLDMTQAIGMAPGLSGLIMYVGSSDAAIFNAMATDSPRCAQLSSSWTWTPADPNTDNPYFLEFAAQGQNLFQAAGDSSKWTTSGTASEIYPADDVYVTAVGGTDLGTSSAAGAWSSESAWADGGGGISPHKYALPAWQDTAASGCSSCSKSYRNGPDVSANANFTFYVCADQTTCTANEYGGTSFATPMWAGYLALANQQAITNTGEPLGFINPALYTIGDGSNYDTDFHDVTSGSNGYSATTGYDLATGWGSPNGSALINDLAGPASTTPGYTLSSSPGAVTIAAGASSSAVSITSTVTNGFSSPVTLAASGEPSGVGVTFAAPGTITGSGSLAVTIVVGSTVAAGTYPITITGTPASGPTETTSVSLTVTSTSSGTFTIKVSPTSASVIQGRSSSTTVTTAVSGGFSSAIGFSASGVPSGVTATFSPASLAAPGSGTAKLSLSVARTATTGTYSITITGTGGEVTKTTTYSLKIER